MPKYLCSIATCNFKFEGSLADIIPPAIGHAFGSHQMDLTEADIVKIIQQQSSPNYPKKEVVIESKKIIKVKQARSNLQVTEEEKIKWWKKMEKHG